MYLGLSTAIKGLDATNFARDRAFKKLSEDEQQLLVSSRKKMLVIRDPLQRQDSSKNTILLIEVYGLSMQNRRPEK